MDFESLLERFATAVETHDSPGLAALFAADGCYDDYFFGPHEGRAAIAEMLDRFHVGGERFCWQWIDPVCAGMRGYAGYCFSYRSREPESAGKLIVFDGVGRFRLRDGLIERYSEVFDRGMAFAQLGYARERIGKLLDRYGQGLLESGLARRHLEYRSARVG